MRRVHYGLLEDAANFPGFPDFRQPALIFHGVNDDGRSGGFVARTFAAVASERES
jgi:hypothetical protein